MDNIVKHLAGLVEAKIELAKIEIKEQVALIASKVVYLAIAVILAFLVLVSLNIGLAALINVWLHSAFWGFFIVAVFYAILMVILLIFREQLGIEKAIHKMAVGMLTNDEGGPDQDPKIITNARTNSAQL